MTRVVTRGIVVQHLGFCQTAPDQT